ncbi:esterase/lipase family protein [Thermodesulfobacteriota bacterium]
MSEPASTRPPVVLIHGYMCLKEMMIPLKLRLTEGGLDARTVDLPPLNLGDVKELSRQFDAKLSEIMEGTGAEKCDLVGVSLGGLIGLYYIKRLGGASRVRRFVALGTPFKGTWLAVAGVLAIGLFSKGAWQSLPESPFLKDLAHGPLPEEVDYYSISVKGDTISPPERSELDGAENIVIEIPELPQPIVHQGLIISEVATSRLLDILLA